jgi:hypothetical protein
MTNPDEEPNTSWRIVCVKQEIVNYPRPHSHVTNVGTGDRPDWADMRWTARQVLAALTDGETFYTQDETTGQTTLIEKSKCPVCEKTCIRSTNETKSSLSDLRNCIYQADDPLPFSES